MSTFRWAAQKHRSKGLTTISAQLVERTTTLSVPTKGRKKPTRIERLDQVGPRVAFSWNRDRREIVVYVNNLAVLVIDELAAVRVGQGMPTQTIVSYFRQLLIGGTIRVEPKPGVL